MSNDYKTDEREVDALMKDSYWLRVNGFEERDKDKAELDREAVKRTWNSQRYSD